MTYLEDREFMAWIRERPDLPTTALASMYEAWKAGRERGHLDIADKLERCAKTGKSWGLLQKPIVTTSAIRVRAEELRAACLEAGIADPNDAEFRLNTTSDGRTELVVLRRRR